MRVRDGRGVASVRLWWRGVSVGAVVVLGVVGLAGCGSSSAVSRPTPSAGSTLSPEQSKQQVMDLYDAIVKITGGKWTVGASQWQDCSPDPAGGPLYANFDFEASRYKQPLGEDPDVVAGKVRDAMRKLGYEVRVQHDTQLTPTRTVIGYPGYLAGTEADGFYFVFTADANFVDFRMDGHCVRGDSYFLETGKHSYED